MKPQHGRRSRQPGDPCRRHTVRGRQTQGLVERHSTLVPAGPAPTAGTARRRVGQHAVSDRTRKPRQRVGQRPAPAGRVDEDTNTLRVFYHDSSGNVYFSESDATNISFGPRKPIMTGGYEYVSTTKDAWAGRLVVLTTIRVPRRSHHDNPGLVGIGRWTMRRACSPRPVRLGKRCDVTGRTPWAPGLKGFALDFDGSTTYGPCPIRKGWTATTGLTLSAWIKPRAQAQDIISRATVGTSWIRLYSESHQCHDESGQSDLPLERGDIGNMFRVNSDTSYPFNGNTWMHVAATYDGTAMRMYVNGIKKNRASALVDRGQCDRRRPRGAGQRQPQVPRPDGRSPDLSPRAEGTEIPGLPSAPGQSSHHED